jgi:hypothetical protein
MGADKNSSAKRELSLYPKFTTKDSHTSLSRSRSHTGPTNPRNKPQTIPKQKHDSTSKGLSCPAKALTDGPQGMGGRSARTGGTVCDPRADGLLNATGTPPAHPETQTVRTLHVDCPRATRATRTVRGLWADSPPNPSRLETAGQTDQNKDAEEHTTTRRTLGQLAPHGLSTPTRQTVRRCGQAREQQPKSKPASTQPPILPWISQTT